MHGQFTLEADWDKRNKVMIKKVIRKAIRDRLHETIQDELDLKDDDYWLVSDEWFNHYLDTTEHNQMRRRETQKITQEDLKSTFIVTDDSPASSRIITKKARK